MREKVKSLVVLALRSSRRKCQMRSAIKGVEPVLIRISVVSNGKGGVKHVHAKRVVEFRDRSPPVGSGCVGCARARVVVSVVVSAVVSAAAGRAGRRFCGGLCGGLGGKSAQLARFWGGVSVVASARS